MNRFRAIALKVCLVAAPLSVALALGAPQEAQAQYVAPPAPPAPPGYVSPPQQVYVAPPAPPAAYIATVQPEYYEGRPVYLYNGNWYYRDAHGWNYYRSEPAYLRDRRAHWADRDHARYHYHR